MYIQVFDVDALIIDQRAVAFDHRGDDNAVFFAEKFGYMITDIAQALNHAGFAGERTQHIGGFDILRVAEEFTQRVLHATTGGFDAALNAAVMQRFAGDAGEVINVFGVQVFVGVGNPGHFSLAGADIGRGHVGGRAEKTFADEFVRKPARNHFEFVTIIFGRVDEQRTFGAAKRHIDDGAFIGHQCGQRFHLVLIGIRRITDAAF